MSLRDLISQIPPEEHSHTVRIHDSFGTDYTLEYESDMGLYGDWYWILCYGEGLLSVYLYDNEAETLTKRDFK